MSEARNSGGIDTDNPIDGMSMGTGTMSPELRQSMMGTDADESDGGPVAGPKASGGDAVLKWIAGIFTAIAGLTTFM